MFSAISHHINKLDEKIEEHEQEINSLKLRDSFCDCSSEISGINEQITSNTEKIDSLFEKLKLIEYNLNFPSVTETEPKKDFPKLATKFSYSEK